MSRPKTEKYKIENLCKEIDNYTKKTELPILKELCYKKDYNYDYLIHMQRDNEELYQSIKKLLYKKESTLERKALNGEMNSTMAIFSLKQLGWKDKQNNEIEERTTPKIEIEVVDNSHLEKYMYQQK